MNLHIPFLPAYGFRARLEEHRPSMLRVAFSWCHDRALAEDLVQDALVKALSQAGSLREHAKLKSWLFVILGNCFRDHLRRRRPHEDIDTIDEAVLSGGLRPDDAHEQAQVVRRVRAAIATLPLGQRQAVTLVDLEGFGYAEVAGILDIPVGTVMSRLSRGRQALRTLLLDASAASGESALRSVK
jgi:RNA polymerase sigma-70 factor (ECF subfamily)